MRYQDTWFSKQPMSMCSSYGNGRQLWLHQYVEVPTGNLRAMNHENPDGSIDVLGTEVRCMSSGLSVSSHSRQSIQNALLQQAHRLSEAGATIVRQTKNTLVARHGNETAHYVITEVCASTFFSKLLKAG